MVVNAGTVTEEEVMILAFLMTLSPPSPPPSFKIQTHFHVGILVCVW